MTPATRAKLETEAIFQLKKNPGPGLCGVKGCRKDAQPKKMRLCHAHWQYRWRMLSPKRSTYATLKTHAKARGLSFTISYDYFLGMLDCARYWDPKAESRGEFPSIDRIDPTRGYEPGNLQVVTISENCAKGNRERHLPAAIQALIDRKRASNESSSNPF